MATTTFIPFTFLSVFEWVFADTGIVPAFFQKGNVPENKNKLISLFSYVIQNIEENRRLNPWPRRSERPRLSRLWTPSRRFAAATLTTSTAEELFLPAPMPNASGTFTKLG
jgi:hypothetical protein